MQNLKSPEFFFFEKKNISFRQIWVCPKYGEWNFGGWLNVANQGHLDVELGRRETTTSTKPQCPICTIRNYRSFRKKIVLLYFIIITIALTFLLAGQPVASSAWRAHHRRPSTNRWMNEWMNEWLPHVSNTLNNRRALVFHHNQINGLNELPARRAQRSYWSSGHFLFRILLSLFF